MSTVLSKEFEVTYQAPGQNGCHGCLAPVKFRDIVNRNHSQVNPLLHSGTRGLKFLTRPLRMNLNLDLSCLPNCLIWTGYLYLMNHELSKRILRLNHNEKLFKCMRSREQFESSKSEHRLDRSGLKLRRTSNKGNSEFQFLHFVTFLLFL